jgi:hypothetical protein
VVRGYSGGKFSTATRGSDGLESLLRLGITLVVQCHSLGIEPVTSKHFFGWCSLWWLEVARGHISSIRSLRGRGDTYAAKGYSHSKERTLTGNLFLPINPFQPNTICHVLLWLKILVVYEWLQTSVQTCKRTNGQVNLNKKVSKKSDALVGRV